MLDQMGGAQNQLDQIVASLNASSTPIPPEIAARYGEVAALIHQITTGSPSELAALKREVAAAVANVATAVNQAQSVQASGTAPGLNAVAEASRTAVNSALDYTRTLKLNFASEEDERAYREREAARRAFIEAEQAKHTPEGDLNAAGATVGQMADAKAHGAHGPEFDRHVDELLQSTAKLRDAMHRAGKSTDAFDARLRVDLRTVMRSRGMSDAEIDAKFAANPDPLEAAKAYLTEKDIRALAVKAKENAVPADSIVITEKPAMPARSMAEAMETLKAAGITTSEHPADAAPAHGVTLQTARATTPYRSA